jgi:hypothetical protein
MDGEVKQAAVTSSMKGLATCLRKEKDVKIEGLERD